MVKILSLIGSFFALIGIVLFSISMQVAQDYGIVEFFFKASILTPDFGLSGVAIILIYLGFILILFSGFFKGNVLLIISSIISILACLGCLTIWLTNIPSGELILSRNYKIFCWILDFGCFLHFIGCLRFKKQNKFAWITALLLFLGTTVYNFFLTRLGIRDSTVIDSYFEDILWNLMILLVAWYGMFFLHGVIFSFSKKQSLTDNENFDEPLFKNL
ncbi:MAG: hypothetical protein ACTSRK_11735 [Promethearchaeota archaeon]